MISCFDLAEIFRSNGLTFFTGVPDSTFKDWMSFLESEEGCTLTNIIASNECEAQAIASGYHLSTGGVAVVYMQNAGFGKVVNPLTSLCDQRVYSIPALLMIGWRGKPGQKDEPQHIRMGEILIPLLDLLKVPYKILPKDVDLAEKAISDMKNIALKESRVCAIIIERDTLDPFQGGPKTGDETFMSREDAINHVVDRLDGDEIIVSTTGKISRELYGLRAVKNQTPRDFYNIGAMGCASAIALGIAITRPNRKVIVFDGDGAALMQLGTLSTIGHYKPSNFIHIIFNNRSYDSTGGQPSVSDTVDFKALSRSCGYPRAFKVKSLDDLKDALRDIDTSIGPTLICIDVRRGARTDLIRPTKSPAENKEEFKKFINQK